MDEERIDAAGAANTPPFARAASSGHEAESVASAAEEEMERGHLTGEREAATPSVRRRAPDGTAGEGMLGRARRTARGAGGDARRLAGEASEELRRRAETGAQRNLDRAADRLQDAASRLERMAEGRLEGGRTGEIAHTTAELIEGAADYLRGSDLHSLRADLARQVREKPLQTILIAAGAGWLLGKIMR